MKWFRRFLNIWTKKRISLFVVLVSCLSQAGFIGFTSWMLQTLTDDISLDMSKIKINEEQTTGIMFFTLLDFAESSAPTINKYVFGEVPRNLDNKIPIEIIGFDCESCEEKIHTSSYKKRYTSSTPQIPLPLNLKTFHFRKPALDDKRAYLPRIFYTVPDRYFSFLLPFKSVSIKSIKIESKRLDNLNDVEHTIQPAASFFSYKNEVMLLAPSYWRNDGFEAYSNVLPHSLLMSVQPCRYTIRARTMSLFVGSLVQPTDDAIVVCDNYGPGTCHLWENGMQTFKPIANKMITTKHFAGGTVNHKGAVIVFGGFDISVSKRLDEFNNFTPENLSDFQHEFQQEQVRYQKIELKITLTQNVELINVTGYTQTKQLERLPQYTLNPLSTTINDTIYVFGGKLLQQSQHVIRILSRSSNSFDHVKQDGRRGVIDQMLEETLLELFYGAQYAMANYNQATANHDVFIFKNDRWIQRTWLTNRKALLATPAIDENYADYVFNIEKQENFSRPNAADAILFTSFAKRDNELYIVGRTGKRNQQHIYKMHSFFDGADARLLDFKTNQWKMKVEDSEDLLIETLFLSQYTMLVGPVQSKTLKAFEKCPATRMEFQMDD